MPDIAVIIAPLLAGLLVVASHVPLGREVLKRGIIFIDLAVAQIAGLGVIVAQVYAIEFSSYAVQITAGIFALLGAFFLQWTEKHWPSIQEAVIGSTFVLAASISLLLLADSPHGAEYLQELLSGQILWVRMEQLPLAAMLFVAVLLCWFFAKGFARGLGFYFLFAVAVTTSVQLVGVYLVFASLIMPAIVVRHLTAGKALFVAYTIGLVSFVSGLLLSLGTDLPASPLIVCSLALTGVLTAILYKPARRQP